MSYDEYRGNLRIDKHNLDEELERHAEIQFHISRGLDLARDSWERAKNKLEEIEAALHKEVVQELRKKYEKAPSVDMIKSEIKSDRERRVCAANVVDCKQELDKWDSLYQSWKARGFALTALSDLAASNWFAKDSGGRSKR